MYLDKIIKGEIKVLVLSVITISIIIFAVFYIKNSNMNKQISNIININNLEIKYCNDMDCNSTYSNFTNIIGIQSVKGESVPKKIKSFENDNDALKDNPYIFNIKNNNKETISLNLIVTEDSNNEYIDKIKIAIANCNNEIDYEAITAKYYNELVDNTLLYNDILLPSNNNTYCVWTWIDNIENYNNDSYFTLKMDFKTNKVDE